MKRHLFFLREVGQSLLSGASYSTACACVASFVFVFMAINCGPPPQGQYHVPESAIAAAEKTTNPQSTQSDASLPKSATIRLEKMAYIRNAFKEPQRARGRTGLADFHARTRGAVQHSAIISNCSLDVLKAFVAKGWAPIVMIQFEGRSPEILPISDYNDQLSEVHLQHPAGSTKRRMSYKDFEASWSKSSRNKCVLITPQQLAETDIRNVLSKYLPSAAFQEISVLSR